MFLKDEECFNVFLRNMFRTFKLKVAKVGPWLSKTGSYTFQLDSDDGSRMYLEGRGMQQKAGENNAFHEETCVNPRMQLNRTDFIMCSSPSTLLAALQSVMELPWLSRIITRKLAFEGHSQSALAGVEIIDHVAWVKLLSTFSLPEWICMDLGFFLFCCKIFHTVLRMAAGQPAKSGL